MEVEREHDGHPARRLFVEDASQPCGARSRARTMPFEPRHLERLMQSMVVTTGAHLRCATPVADRGQPGADADRGLQCIMTCGPFACAERCRAAPPISIADSPVCAGLGCRKSMLNVGLRRQRPSFAARRRRHDGLLTSATDGIDAGWVYQFHFAAMTVKHKFDPVFRSGEELQRLGSPDVPARRSTDKAHQAGQGRRTTASYELERRLRDALR